MLAETCALSTDSTPMPNSPSDLRVNCNLRLCLDELCCRSGGFCNPGPVIPSERRVRELAHKDFIKLSWLANAPRIK